MDDEYALFAAVVEHGSLSAAARAMRLSPAMASRRLARLEDRLGARLLNRTTRRQSPTEAGAVFYRRVVEILAASREAEALVAGGARTAAGPLRITAPTSFGRMHVAPYLKGFLDRHPKVALRLDLSDAYVDLVGERYDLAIRIGQRVEASMVGVRLASNRRVLCASPAYIAEHGEPRALRDLSGHRLLAAAGQSPWRLQGPNGAVSVTIDSRVATNSSEVVRELAVAGAGIALRSTWDIHQDLAAGRLRVVLPDHQGAQSVGLYAVHPRSDLVPASVVAFVAYLADLYGDHPPWEDRAE
ncbi:LysR family transcriptional regulator [uncultured Brevundimonas sp.]|uniref:LysR family transcriptional regulator n=1 Tax=uncultured Brevundimonas sp. TaxID=213418 RepID=UPI002595773E|nr:LysR family transcriptional regulator [uncultured Brevundimonas sp.]